MAERVRTMRRAAEGLPMRVKPTLMGLPGWKRVIYPLWLRWYRWRLTSRGWQEGSYEPGDVARWHGVRLVCCTSHFAGMYAEHPWDPGWGWPDWKAAALWEPKGQRDRLLLRIVGDPRRRTAPSQYESGEG